MRTIKLLFIATFIMLLWAPLLKSISSDVDQTMTDENRKRHPAPALRFTTDSVSAFPHNFDDYYQDVFGYRDRLINKNRRFRMQLGMSISENVIIGKDGWYFFAGDNLMNDYRGLTPFSLQQLEQFRLVMEEKQAWLKSQGIGYLFVMTPNKVSIYPEYMSDKYPRIAPLTHADQYIPYLQSNSNLNFIDLRPPLLAAKQHERVYHKVDTHWNDRGAYVGYIEIINNLKHPFPSLEATDISHFDKVTTMGSSGDLGLLMGRQQEIQEEYRNLQPKFTRCAKRVPYLIESVKGHPNRDDVVFATECSKNSLKALVFRDSFTMMLQPFLSESFGKVIYINKPYNHSDAIEVIRREKPDVVIEQSVERHVELTEQSALYSEATHANEFSSYGEVQKEINHPEQLLNITGMAADADSSGFELTTDSSNAYGTLFSANGQRYMVMINIHSPQESFLRVAYTVREPGGRLANASRDYTIVKGDNRVYIDLRAYPLEGELRLTPGLAPDRYRVNAITIRGMQGSPAINLYHRQ